MDPRVAPAILSEQVDEPTEVLAVRGCGQCDCQAFLLARTTRSQIAFWEYVLRISRRLDRQSTPRTLHHPVGVARKLHVFEKHGQCGRIRNRRVDEFPDGMNINPDSA